MILFDEPTEGIQPSIIEELVVVLRQLHASQGLTILLVEQNLEFIAELAQRVLLIQKGTILRELRPEELRHADVLNEFVGVAAEAEEPPSRPMRQG
jgi:branched-chain amino acid transport system ATP-binding protein